MRKIKEECGVFGIWAPERSSVAHLTYYGLFALQHRGQEAAGIAVNDDGLFRYYKDTGLVQEVFDEARLRELGQGEIAVGHVRYSTSGDTNRANAQPVVINHIKGHTALCHNGNLVNSYELRTELEMQGCIFNTSTDNEVISHILTRQRIQSGSIEEALCKTMNIIEGAYSLVLMSPRKLIACRDKNGFRPLCYGKTAEGMYVIASESCALEAVGAELIRDVKPGEIIVIDEKGLRSIEEHCGKAPATLCIFEYIYFARPDSVIEGAGVHEARIRAGSFLAKEHPVEADIVIGVPDSGLDAAIGYARESGIPYGIGLIKSKYIGRTFIAPDQQAREKLVRLKLNPIAEVIRNKRVVLIDDSIVRGTTSARIIRLIREAGAREVHMRVSAPAFINPCFYGTDIDSKDKLIACLHSHREIEEIIGVDSLGFLSVDSAKKLPLCPRADRGYCTACFDGSYPTTVPTKSSKSRFEQKLSESRQKGR